MSMLLSVLCYYLAKALPVLSFRPNNGRQHGDPVHQLDSVYPGGLRAGLQLGQLGRRHLRRLCPHGVHRDPLLHLSGPRRRQAGQEAGAHFLPGLKTDLSVICIIMYKLTF